MSKVSIKGFNEYSVYDRGQINPEKFSDGTIVTITGSLLGVYSTRSGEYFGYPPIIPPMEQSFPLTVEEWTNTFPSVATPTSTWGFDESSFDFVDRIGANDLTQGGAGTFSFGQIGDDPIFPTKEAGVANATTSNARVITDTTIFNITTDTNNEIISGLLRCGEITKDGSLYRPVVSKRSRLSSATGYRVVINPSTGYLRLWAEDSTSQAFADIEIDHSNEWFYVGFTVSRVSNTINLYSKLNGVFRSASASIAGFGSLSNAIRYTHGCPNAVETDPGSQWSWSVAWFGTEITSEQFQSMMIEIT